MNGQNSIRVQIETIIRRVAEGWTAEAIVANNGREFRKAVVAAVREQLPNVRISDQEIASQIWFGK